MDRERLRPVVVALLVVVVIGIAAATIANPVDEGGGSGGFGGGSGIIGGGEGSNDDTGLSPTNESSAARTGLSLPQPCVAFLLNSDVQAAAIIIVAAGLYLLYRRTDALSTVAIGVAFGMPVTVIYLLLTAGCAPSDRPPADITGSIFPSDGRDPGLLPSGGGGFGGESSGAVPPATLLVVVVLLIAIVAIVVLLLFGSPGEDDDGNEPAETAEPDADVAAIGQVAREAADRIEDSADVDNEVYRAWTEMTDHVPVAHPESSTPGEFATAAVEAGMERDDVDELTRLFEAVRYGGEAPTAERETQALSALRRIEESYAEPDEAAGDDGSRRDRFGLDAEGSS